MRVRSWRAWPRRCPTAPTTATTATATAAAVAVAVAAAAATLGAAALAMVAAATAAAAALMLSGVLLHEPLCSHGGMTARQLKRRIGVRLQLRAAKCFSPPEVPAAPAFGRPVPGSVELGCVIGCRRGLHIDIVRPRCGDAPGALLPLELVMMNGSSARRNA